MYKILGLLLILSGCVGSRNTSETANHHTTSSQGCERHTGKHHGKKKCGGDCSGKKGHHGKKKCGGGCSGKKGHHGKKKCGGGCSGKKGHHGKKKCGGGCSGKKGHHGKKKCGGGCSGKKGHHHVGHKHAGNGHKGHHGGGGHEEKVHHHSFADVEKWSKIFDDPKRDAWQKPKQVMTLLNIAPGAKVADIGAGTGYFLPYLSAAVGNNGKVHALDVEQSLVDHMNKRILRQKLTNALSRLISVSDPGLVNGSTDLILIVNTWHHIAGRMAYGAKLKNALTAGGKVAIVDYTQESPMGPPKQHRLSASEVVSELSAAGFNATILETELPHQYIVVGIPK